MLHVVFHRLVNCSHLRLLCRKNTYTLPERSVVSHIGSFTSLIHFSFFLRIIISLFFLQISIQFLLIIWDTIVMVDYFVCFEYFEYCLFIIITKELFHQKQILFSKMMDERCNFLISFFNFIVSSFLSVFSLYDTLTLPVSSSLFHSPQNKQQPQFILFL